ncbi:MAG: ABC transporter substrate-binding protein, partial [Acidimicrobiales bacterium]
MLKRFRILRWLATVVATVGMVTFGTVAISSSPAGAASVTKTVVVSSTEGPAVTVNWIFPFMTIAYFSVQNIDLFEYYMYRPLYWLGSHNAPTLNKRYSLASTPVASNTDKTFTINLKTYKWSDTEQVTATDVLFWMNIWHQKPTGYAGWFPGGLSLPTSVKSIKVTSPSTVTFTMTTPVNPHWFLYNELSEITPLPLAWTKTSPTAPSGSGGCAKATFTTTTAKGTNGAKCTAVYDFLSTESGHNPTKPTTKINALPTYATNPLWKVVDGPWMLSSFTATTTLVLVPNPSYSGPNKPRV